MATPPKPVEDPERDLGFGGRVAQETRQRFLNRDGSFNVERHGPPFFRSLTLYHAVLNVYWPAYFLIAALAASRTCSRPAPAAGLPSTWAGCTRSRG